MKHKFRNFVFFNQLTAILAICMLTFFTSCENEVLVPETPASVEVKNSKNAITPYIFNWNDPNLNFMPYPAGQPVIPPPWTGQGGLSSSVSIDVLDDRLPSDGWVMVYSTFHPTIWSPNPYFILYNKYRGLMRIFLYLNSVDNIIESSYLQSGLRTQANTSLLNFAETEIVDYSLNKKEVDRIEATPLDGAPTANFRWYFFQYEMAYDPILLPVPPMSPNAPQFTFYLKTINVQQLSLGGTLQAKIKGSIGASSTTYGSNIFGAVTGQLQSLGAGSLTAIGNKLIKAETTDSITGENKLGVLATIWKSVKSGLDAAMTSETAGIPQSITNVLSAVLKGSTSNAGQTVSLTLGGTMNLQGTLTGVAGFPSTPIDMYIPGGLAAPYGVQYYVPLYNMKLGVFNLGAKPTVKIDTKRYPGYGGGPYTFETTYSVSGLDLKWNPDVLAVANIQNLTTTVIATFQPNIATNLITMTGRNETIKGMKAFSGYMSSGTTFKTVHVATGMPSEYQDVILRISFVVVPKDGSPSSVIVKSFVVNKQKSFTAY